MDTSETYIKMCEKAEEIQDNMPYFSERLSSVFWIKDSKSLDGRVTVQGWDEITTATWTFVWLPRQDQLQEMVGSYEVVLEYWKHITWHWWHDEDGEFHNSNISIRPYLGIFTSLEQLWLAFVMKEKHSKVWNGQEWE